MKLTAVIFDWGRMLREMRLDIMDPMDKNAQREATAMAVQQRLYTTYEVEAPHYDDAYATLNINKPADYKLRSMSIGDIFIDFATDDVVQVASFGFEPVRGGAKHILVRDIFEARQKQ